MTAQVKRALVAAGITLALSVNAAVPAAAATSGSERSTASCLQRRNNGGRHEPKR
jgi:hypothetical protein